MRNASLAMLALLSVGSVTMIGATPAAAYDYPYCLQCGELGYPGECLYPSYEACKEAASGREVYCGVNPRAALNPPPGLPLPPGFRDPNN